MHWSSHLRLQFSLIPRYFCLEYLVTIVNSLDQFFGLLASAFYRKVIQLIVFVAEFTKGWAKLSFVVLMFVPTFPALP